MIILLMCNIIVDFSFDRTHVGISEKCRFTKCLPYVTIDYLHRGLHFHVNHGLHFNPGSCSNLFHLGCQPELIFSNISMHKCIHILPVKNQGYIGAFVFYFYTGNVSNSHKKLVIMII